MEKTSEVDTISTKDEGESEASKENALVSTCVSEEEESNDEAEEKMQGFLDSIKGETAQLSESLGQETKLVNDICSTLTLALTKLNVSVSIPPKDLPLRKGIAKVILSKEGNLKLYGEDGELKSYPLAEYPPEIVMAVLWVVIPELAKIVTLYRKKITTRISFLEGIRKELKVVVSAIAGSEDSAKGTVRKPKSAEEKKTETQE